MDPQEDASVSKKTDTLSDVRLVREAGLEPARP